MKKWSPASEELTGDDVTDEMVERIRSSEYMHMRAIVTDIPVIYEGGF